MSKIIYLCFEVANNCIISINLYLILLIKCVVNC